MSLKRQVMPSNPGHLASAWPSRSALRCAVTILALGAAFTGCENRQMDVPEPMMPGDPGPLGDPTSVGTTPGGPAVASCTNRTLEPRAVWLSEIQYTTAITKLFNDPNVLEAEQIEDPAFKAFSQKGVVVNTSLLRTRLDIAQTAAANVTGSFQEKTGCAPTDDTCARAYVNTLAERAFRRPVLDAERTDLAAVYEVGAEADVETGVELAIQAILSSPSFNYRTEFGSPNASGALELTDHEVASMLSFWLTDGPPDADLLAAANQGTLKQPAELSRQVGRILDTPEAKNAVVLTLMSAWGMSNVFGSTKDPGLFPGYGPLLASSMFEETRLFLNDALWGEGGSLGKALTSNKTFVNADLAELYGVQFPGTDPTQFVPVELPANERAGLLTQASLLTARARSDNTSVVARGLFVRAALMCLQRPPPPPEAVIAQVQALLAADMTERERADFRAMTDPCRGCHSSIDGFGLMLENYDAIGRYREELKGEPIDPTVELDKLGFPGTFEGVVDFAQTAAESPQFTSCVARHLAVYATGDDAVATRDCELKEFSEKVPTETSLREVVTSLASSALLRTRSGE